MKLRYVFWLIALAWLGAGLSGCTQAQELQTEAVQRGVLRLTANANGIISAGQSAVLAWKTSGTVGNVAVQPGDAVVMGQDLSRLEQTSLPQAVILAQIELINARRTLDELQNSDRLRAQALQAVEQAEQALEDGRNPELLQARLQADLASARQELVDAERAHQILIGRPSQLAIDQAAASLLQAENVVLQTETTIEKMRNRLVSLQENPFFDISGLRIALRRGIEGLEMKLIQDQGHYQDTLQRYNSLLQPPDPLDLAEAQARLALARAQLGQAERDWQRQKDGLSQAELAVLEASLQDARREAERLKDGPTQQDIATAQARLAAAQATLSLASLSAPFDATVTQVLIHPGDMVHPGMLAIRLDKLDELQVLAQVTEADINRIQVGQPAIITLDSVPGREYQGEVVEIPAVGNVLNEIVTFTVKVRLERPDSQVRPGMTASVKIIIGELADTLLIPSSTVRFVDGQRYVYIQREAALEPVPVTLGASAEGYSQLLAGGVQEGDLLVLNPPEQP